MRLDYCEAFFFIGVMPSMARLLETGFFTVAAAVLDALTAFNASFLASSSAFLADSRSSCS